ncbi:ABC transporter permease [Reichenbachiella ulvae]|uniref:ABC transporter permease n=1 Tax=Reichenbachiella ulvae TaxID=2980104 RepID=A0ABT3CN85_9BACT|nr:ABC transporter permease [Reichenbachiella ulvae]MCV9385049.1 ABC transporter permease [Reichenbachiella ulvae]
MFSRDRWQEIFQAISKNKLRTSLSGFTVALGIFIFVILFGFGNGLKNTFQEFFMDDATNTIFIYPNRTTMPYKGYKSNRQIEFDNEDLEVILEEFAPFIQYITPRIYRNFEFKYEGESNTYPVRAVAPPHQFLEKTIMMKGRYINEKDILKKEKYIVIGRLIEQDLFDGQDALGKFIDMRNSNYKIIGVFQDDGGDREERTAYMPYTTLQLNEMNNDKINQIVIGFKPEIGYMGAMGFYYKLQEFMKERHFVNPEDQAGIYFRNVAENFQQNQQLATVLQIIVSLVGLGTLIAGVIGISNIMVFTVKERTKELGIRKALGATPATVTGMILQESIFITIIAGYLGLFAGVMVLQSVGDKLKDYFITNPYLDMNTGIAATLALVLFGAIAGYIPARRAARIKPIVALRDE